MKYRVMVFMIMAMAMATLAMERLPRPEDRTYGENVINLLQSLLFLAFITPVGWTILILIIIGIVKTIYKSGKVLATTDYTRIPESDKRDRILEELEKDHQRNL